MKRKPYSSALGLAVARLVAIGESLHGAARQLGLTSHDVARWIDSERECAALVELSCASSLYRLLHAVKHSPVAPETLAWARAVVRGLYAPDPKVATERLNLAWATRPDFPEVDRLLMGEIAEDGAAVVLAAARKRREAPR